MQQVTNPEEYIRLVPEDKRESFAGLRDTILAHLPEGFEETIGYNMIGYVVPHKLYPSGYHANSSLPLPFINIGVQKHHIALYHFGLYADKNFMKWFTEEYSRLTGKKPDMGKSCIRFRKSTMIPLHLIGEIVEKIRPEDWISLYESQIRKK